MKRLILLCAILLAFFAAALAHAQTPMGHLFTCLVGGTTGCIDKVDAEDLSDGMFALAVVSNVFYVYQYDADSTVADDGITAIRPDYYTTPTVPWSQGVWLLVGTTSRDVLPGAADTYSLGSATREWANLYLGDSGVIYGQNDQSATLTSSASKWTANNFGISTQFQLPSSDADPTATAGYLRHDSTVTNHANGALRWSDGTNTRQLVDLIAATAEGCTDDQVVAYDADNDRFYCKNDASGTGDVANDTIWDAAGDMVVGTGANTAARVALGTPGQIWKVNAGATSGEWSSTLNISGLTLGGIVLGDDTPDADGEIGYASNAYKFYANSEDMVITFGANSLTWSSNTGVTSMSFSALNLVTTGTIAGGIPQSEDNNGKTLTAAEQYGYFHWATGAGTWNLAAAANGMHFCIYSTTAAAIVINPDNADTIVLDGTALSAGDSITSDSTAGAQICLIRKDGGNWYTVGRVGTWTDTN